MKEIPIHYIKANQIGIVLFAGLAILLRQPLIVVFLLAVELLGLMLGLKWNLFVIAVRPIVKNKIANAKTQASELTKFNNTLAIIFLIIALLFFSVGLNLGGFIVLGMLAGVVSVALFGYCFGCFLYYQYKRLMK